MDPNQEQTLLRAIAVSSIYTSAFSAAERQSSFTVLEEFKKYDGRIAVCVTWIQSQFHLYEGHDVTVATKLLALEILASFLQEKKGGSYSYSTLSEQDRITLRQAVMKSSRLLCHQSQQSRDNSQTRILGRKLASIIGAIAIRDFPQRWTSFISDLFKPYGQGGLWYDEASAESGRHAGIKICLECLQLLAEDCTDSDFNAKVPTSRRNDVLKGLNEVVGSFLPLLYQLLEHYVFLQQSQASLFEMHKYLITQNRSIHTLSEDEAASYKREKTRSEDLALLIADTLVLLQKFCFSMPMSWMIGGSPDFSLPMLHLLREPAADIQVKAIECLDQLVTRGKLETHQWIDLLEKLPAAVQEANHTFSTVEEFRRAEIAACGDTSQHYDPLTEQLGFHKALARLLSNHLSSYIGFITSSKSILSQSGAEYDKFNVFALLTVEMLRHPSGRVCSEQLNTWATLFREPQLSRLLAPYLQDIILSFMNQMVRIRWEDVENETHPYSQLLEKSFEDMDGYDSWMSDVRSRASSLFKYAGNVDPCIVAQTLVARLESLLQSHGNGEPLNYLDPSTGQVTQLSDAVMQFEAIALPMENLLSGLPSWSMDDNAKQCSNYKENKTRHDLRAGTKAALAELVRCLVAWNPAHLWLRFRRTFLLEAARFIWKYEPSTLLQGVESLIGYLGLKDEWSKPGNQHDNALSPETVGLKKRSGSALVSIAKVVPQHLVPWLSQLSDATRSLLALDGLIPLNQTHLFEFLSCVATAVDDHQARSNFIGGVLSTAIETLESHDIQRCISSVPSLLESLGVTEVVNNPAAATDPEYVHRITQNYYRLFTPLNQLLSVGKRCQEATRKKRSNIKHVHGFAPSVNSDFTFPDEGPVSINDLAVDDPFVSLWPRFLPALIQVYEVTLAVWRPEQQAVLLRNPYQRYIYAISEDEAFLSKNHDAQSGGVFGEGGTAGSVVTGASRRDVNLVPKWSGWFNELRNTCFQLMGLLSTQRVLFAPEIAHLYPRLVTILTEPSSLRSMEHRHFSQFFKHVIVFLLTCSPSTLYKTHIEPIIGPIFEHIRFRLEKTWDPVLNASTHNPNDVALSSRKALSTPECDRAAALAAQGGESWYTWYYGHAGLFVGELDAVTSEAAVEKSVVELSRTFSDVMQVALALKGEWALVLANLAKEEQSSKKSDPSAQSADGLQVNANGTVRTQYEIHEDARKLQRIKGLCHFLFLESETIASNLTLTVIQCLGYPDAYTCRRVTKICHRILETTGWSPHYVQLLGQQMFSQAVKNVVTEPKWMVGIEWDMINVIRDIYCRMVLGQTLQFGGQGAALQQSRSGPTTFEQAKTVNEPLQGGGIQVSPCAFPRQILASLPGVSPTVITEFEQNMSTKRSAKDQKDFIREILRMIADSLSDVHLQSVNWGAAAGMFDRAGKDESLLHLKSRTSSMPDLPEKLVTYSEAQKASQKAMPEYEGLYNPGVI